MSTLRVECNVKIYVFIDFGYEISFVSESKFGNILISISLTHSLSMGFRSNLFCLLRKHCIIPDTHMMAWVINFSTLIHKWNDIICIQMAVLLIRIIVQCVLKKPLQLEYGPQNHYKLQLFALIITVTQNYKAKNCLRQSSTA